MGNRIYSALPSTLSTRAANRSAYRHSSKPTAAAQAFLAGEPLASAKAMRSKKDMHAFAMAASAIREEEKARLARELHDELAQSLTALKMDTMWVLDRVQGRPEGIAAKLAEMVQMIDETVAATRRMAADLRPLLLDDLGLVPAIEWLASNFSQRHAVRCSLSAADDLALPEPYATAVFRIVQESLNNIAKHARASQARITLETTPDALHLLVQDDGCGFSPGGMRKPQSLGLLGLRERAELLGGDVAIDSAPGHGTCIRVQIPLRKAGAVS